ncbi:MAG: hypothetical protein LBO02_01900 [Holosporaceae bacterium]|jgi:hypothetical protein|nr:hypothetical protein [Holosporaceae bacterium]
MYVFRKEVREIFNSIRTPSYNDFLLELDYWIGEYYPKEISILNRRHEEVVISRPSITLRFRKFFAALLSASPLITNVATAFVRYEDLSARCIKSATVGLKPDGVVVRNDAERITAEKILPTGKEFTR